MSRIPDDAQIERLALLLEQRAVPFRGFNLEALDGYLTTLVLSPEPVAPEQWQPAIWGMPPRWGDEREHADIQALLQDQWHLATQRVCFEGEDLPAQLAPLLWLPEAPEAEDDAALDVGRDWAYGFFRGVELRAAAWDRWLDETEWVDHCYTLLDQLASGELLTEEPGVAPTPISYRQRLDVIGSLPGMLMELQRHRIDALTPRKPIRRAPTAQRNAPCPCGSGRKFKKCCSG